MNDIKALALKVSNRIIAEAEKPVGVSVMMRGNLIDTSLS